MNDGNPELSELASWDKRPRQIINQSNDKKIKLLLRKTQEQTRLNIRYTKKLEFSKDRWILPKAIFKDYLNGRLYLDAFCETRNHDRVFDISRINIISSKD